MISVHSYGTRVRIIDGNVEGVIIEVIIGGPQHTVKYAVEYWADGNINTGMFFADQLEPVRSRDPLPIGFMPRTWEGTTPTVTA